MLIRNRIVGTRKKDKVKSTYEYGDLLCELRVDVLYISGSLTINESAYFTDEIGKYLKSAGQPDITFDLDQLWHIDSAGVMSLYYVKDLLAELGISVNFRGGSDSISRKLEIFSPEKVYKAATPVKAGFFERIGTSVVLFFTDYVFGFMLLAANVFYWSVSDLFKPKSRREGEFVNQSIHIGVNATLIVVFLSFVIGYVMALQSSSQLRTFGANIFVVDLVVIAVTSQMGPLITAILVAGRSGSAIAAEIATMKVTTELDALKTMGLNPIRFVVVPKLYACLFTMPFLVLLANVAGVLGGALAANVYLDITPEIFFNRAGEVMSNKNLLTSFVKSQVYASIIVLTGSFYGFRVVRGAEGVGKVTTISVVVAITLVILADSILGLLFY
jgi:phospholipid/cholesterol/gamma-HCH transport system permease protein